MKRQTLNVDEAARILGVAAPTIYAAVKRGEIPAVRIGDRVLIPKTAIQHMLDPNTMDGPEEDEPKDDLALSHRRIRE